MMADFNNFICSLLDESHLESVLGLDELAIKNLPDGFYRKTNVEMIEKSLDSGLSMGLFKDDKMIGYRLTLLPYPNSYNLGHFLEF